MSYSDKTPNLNLPQWVGTEKPERTDFNAAFTAIDAAIGGIIESGSNANGNWIKFADGTMVCTIRKTITGITSTSSRTYGGYRSETFIIDYPQTFVGTVATVGTLINVNLNGLVFPNTVSDCALLVQTIDSVSTPFNVTVAIIAIGKWK